MIKLTLLSCIIFIGSSFAALSETLTVIDGNIQATSTAYTNTYTTSLDTNFERFDITVIVRQGEVAKVISAQSGTDLGSGLQVTWVSGTTNAPMPINLGPTVPSVNSTPGDCVVGPGFFWLRGFSTFHRFATLQITRNDEPFVPNGAVLVPADLAGPVNVIMESSTNLVTWTATLPGTYGSTAQNQYFRVRAVRQ